MILLIIMLGTRLISCSVKKTPHNIYKLLKKHKTKHKHHKHKNKLVKSTQMAQTPPKHSSSKGKNISFIKIRDIQFYCIFVCQNSESRNESLCGNILFSIEIEDKITDDINDNDPNLLNLKTVIEFCQLSSKVSEY